MIFREIGTDEIEGVLEVGYGEWAKGRTLLKYIEDNRKEDDYGTRYVLVDRGEILVSMILLTLDSVVGRKTFGIGSLVTPKTLRGRGYAKKIIVLVLGLLNEEDLVFLNSDLDPSFYEPFGFKILPETMQAHKGAVTMVRSTQGDYEKIIAEGLEVLPDYF